MRIRLINPNTTAGMTHKIGLVAAALASPGTEISASNPESGPVSVESHFDEAFGAVGVLEEIRNAELAGGLMPISSLALEIRGYWLRVR